MEKIAGALGRKTEFFMSDSFCVPKVNEFKPDRIAFYAGNPTTRQDEIAEKLEMLMENIDEVLSAKKRFLNIILCLSYSLKYKLRHSSYYIY